ncbi:MAG: hypothetical protein EPO06_08670 [Burkholderiaceae bacterium]|nr:MAG: hypothetical protein EPO06_08670 [Burkholderiaceae bacterium]
MEILIFAAAVILTLTNLVLHFGRLVRALAILERALQNDRWRGPFIRAIATARLLVNNFSQGTQIMSGYPVMGTVAVAMGATIWYLFAITLSAEAVLFVCYMCVVPVASKVWCAAFGLALFYQVAAAWFFQLGQKDRRYAATRWNRHAMRLKHRHVQVALQFLIFTGIATSIATLGP